MRDYIWMGVGMGWSVVRWLVPVGTEIVYPEEGDPDPVEHGCIAMQYITEELIGVTPEEEANWHADDQGEDDDVTHHFGEGTAIFDPEWNQISPTFHTEEEGLAWAETHFAKQGIRCLGEE